MPYRESFKIFAFALVFFTLTYVVLSMFGVVGKIGSTVVERKVFENSYQRSEGLKEREATYQAQLAQINSLINSSSNENVDDLKAQRAMLQTQLRTVQGIK